MRLDQPRIAPLSDEAISDEGVREIFAQMSKRGPVQNVFRTLAAAPDALRGFMGWGRYVLSSQNALPLRERQMAILRIGFLCRSGYEWASHSRYDERVGLDAADLEKIKAGPGALGWSDKERAVLRAADELHFDSFISDRTWNELGHHFNEKQKLDLVLTVGHYTQVSMILNSLGVQLDEGWKLDPDLKGS